VKIFLLERCLFQQKKAHRLTEHKLSQEASESGLKTSYALENLTRESNFGQFWLVLQKKGTNFEKNKIL